MASSEVNHENSHELNTIHFSVYAIFSPAKYFSNAITASKLALA
jgi:hypothetical protein